MATKRFKNKMNRWFKTRTRSSRRTKSRSRTRTRTRTRTRSRTRTITGGSSHNAMTRFLAQSRVDDMNALGIISQK